MWLVSFFNNFSNEIILSVFPAFFSAVLKSGAASLGIIEGVADGFANLTKIFSGRLSDKTGFNIGCLENEICSNMETKSHEFFRFFRVSEE